MPPTTLLRAALWIIIGEWLFASMGVGVRMVSTELSNEMIVFIRNLFALGLMITWLIRDNHTLHTRVFLLHFIRAAAGVAAMYCFFYALAHINLAEAMLLKLTAPLFIPVIAIFWMNERVSFSTWLAVALGFVGVIIIIQPQGLDISPVIWIGLLGGVFTAIAMVTIRRLSRTEPTGRILFYFTLLSTIVTALPMLWSWQTPSFIAWLWLLMIAMFATLGQWALTMGLTLAPASQIGVFNYFSIIFAGGYGWLLWQEPLTWHLLTGAALISIAGVLTSRRDKRDTLTANPVVD